MTAPGTNHERSVDSIKLLVRHLAGILILIILNLICYRRTFNGYFLADDFVHVAYLADVFNGHPFKLLENFTGNWMHAWGTQFYRPLISLTLAWDFLLGHGAAIYFHISNIAFHIASSIFLYLIAERLLTSYPWKARLGTALAAASLFALCPLHTEVVSWIIGRVDGVCLAFFLAALYCFICSLQFRSKALTILGLAGFALSLLSKEMAVTLPPLLVLTNVLLSSEQDRKTRIVSAFKSSTPYWIMLALYICIRILALGTPTGGYGGSIGEGLSGSLTQRLLSLYKLLFPFNAELIPAGDRLFKQLLLFYKCATVFIVLRLILWRDFSAQIKLLFYCIAWFLLALAPTYQVFNITDSLMCSRFAYFATAPFCLFIAFSLGPLWKGYTGFQRAAGTWFTRGSAVLLIALSLIYLNITVKNNNAWAHAGSQVREFRKAVESACRGLKDGENIALLNVPQDLEGAHMIYNGAMLNVLLSSPLTNPPVADRVISFEPPTYGDAEFINASRLHDVISKQSHARTYYWDMKAKQLISLDLQKKPLHFSFAVMPPADVMKNHSNLGRIDIALTLRSPTISVDPLSCDFIVVKMNLFPIIAHHTKSWRVPELRLFWSSKNYPEFSVARSISLPVTELGKHHSYVFSVSERKSWIAGGEIQRLKLEIPEGWTPLSAGNPQNPETGDCISLISGENSIPTITPNELAEGKDSIFRMASDHFEVNCDASRIPGCKKIRLELSKPNSWFEHYSGSFRDTQLSTHALKTYDGDGNTAMFKFQRSEFPMPAYYELRCFALDEKGRTLGYCSDPINLQIN